jgi:hypothetical protein
MLLNGNLQAFIFQPSQIYQGGFKITRQTVEKA